VAGSELQLISLALAGQLQPAVRLADSIEPSM
jgi:hypothetical protein